MFYIIFFYDFIILTETWLNSDSIDPELGFTLYNTFKCYRNINTNTLSSGWGVLVAINKNLNLKEINIDKMNVEQMFIKLIYDGLKIIVCAIYIPPRFT